MKIHGDNFLSFKSIYNLKLICISNENLFNAFGPNTKFVKRLFFSFRKAVFSNEGKAIYISNTDR